MWIVKLPLTTIFCNPIKTETHTSLHWVKNMAYGIKLWQWAQEKKITEYSQTSGGIWMQHCIQVFMKMKFSSCKLSKFYLESCRNSNKAPHEANFIIVFQNYILSILLWTHCSPSFLSTRLKNYLLSSNNFSALFPTLSKIALWHISESSRFLLKKI